METSGRALGKIPAGSEFSPYLPGVPGALWLAELDLRSLFLLILSFSHFRINKSPFPEVVPQSSHLSF